MNLGPGTIVAGKYRIERVLGQGGMGVVVAATHVHLDERVALKFLLPEVLGNAEAVARFAREARAAVKIKSEHVARVTDVGALENGAPFMVMEFLTGTDLAARLHDHGRFEIPAAVELVLQACEALAEAHALGIVHRDLKPANLFLTQRADGSPCIKVLDFGISKATGAGMSMTRTSAVMGSPLYMSPEQMTSARDVDVRTDVWAVGVILYELISGRVPFEAASLPQLYSVILQQPPTALAAVRPDVPSELANVVYRCLEKDRTRRFSNIAELAAALQAFAPDTARYSVERVSRVLGFEPPLGASKSISTGGDTVVMTSGGSTNATWGQTRPELPMQRTRWMLPVGLVIAFAAGGLWLWHRSGTNEPGFAASSAPTASLPIASAPGPTSVAPVETPSSIGPTAPATSAVAPSAPSSTSAHTPPGHATRGAVTLSAPAARSAAPSASSPPAPAASSAPKRPSMEDLIRDRH